ncbi:MAG: TetR/AcrR family transcriptional regulator [Myxococcota bacterium]
MSQSESAERIRRAATLLFVERGYRPTTLQNVADEAGVAKGLVAFHFGGKRQLLGAVLESYYEAQRAALSAASVPSDPPRERLLRLLAAYFDFACKHPRFPRLVQMVSEEDDETRALVQARIGAMYRHVEALLLEGAPKTGALSARQCYISFSGLVVNYFAYAELLEPAFGRQPFSKARLAERRAHVLRVAELIYEELERTSV